MKKTQYNKLKLWRCRNMDDITKSLLDIKEKISSIEIGSVENQNKYQKIQAKLKKLQTKLQRNNERS